MPISDDAARAERIRDIAEILARGLQRLSHARESSEKSSPDALSFRDTPCSVSTTVNGSGAREKENDDVWFALVALLTIGAGTR